MKADWVSRYQRKGNGCSLCDKDGGQTEEKCLVWGG